MAFSAGSWGNMISAQGESREIMYLCLMEERTRPLFCETEGYLVASGAMNNKSSLEIVKIKEFRDIVLCSSDEIWETYNIGKSCWWWPQTKVEEWMPYSMIDLVNYWKVFEIYTGDEHGGSMRDYYINISLVRNWLLSYSESLWDKLKFQTEVLSRSSSFW